MIEFSIGSSIVTSDVFVMFSSFVLSACLFLLLLVFCFVVVVMGRSHYQIYCDEQITVESTDSLITKKMILLL